MEWLHHAVIAQAGGGGAGSWSFIPMMLIMFGIMYFLVIRPQSKKQKEHQDFLSRLKSGDQVITQGGLLGEIVNVEEATVTVKLDDKVRVKVVRSHILGLQSSTAEDKK